MCEWAHGLVGNLLFKKHLLSYTNENMGSNLKKSQKKRLWNKSIKKKKYLGVVPLKVPVAQRQSVYNTVVYPTRFAKVRIWRWLSPYKRKVTGSKPVGDIYHITSHRCIKALEHTLNRHGAAAARAAHNREDTGSKPVVGISHHIAPVHQGTRAPFKPAWRSG